MRTKTKLKSQRENPRTERQRTLHQLHRQVQCMPRPVPMYGMIKAETEYTSQGHENNGQTPRLYDHGEMEKAHQKKLEKFPKCQVQNINN